MALGRAIRAGAAYVELTVNDSKMAKGLKAAQARLMSFGATLRGLSGPMAGFGLAGAIGLGKTIEMAADAQEGLAKFGSVMGSETDKAGAFVDDLAERVGRSAIDIRDSMSSFQAMFVGLNFDNAGALEMSKTLQSLAIDFAAFHNLSDEEAIERFLAAMGGSSEVFDRFGINTKEAAMNQQFLKMGLKTTTAKATEQQKVMARLNIIMEAMGKQGATGAAVRESGSLANRLKALKASVKDTAVTIGGALLPVVLPLVQKVGAAAKVVADWAEANPELAATVMKVVLGVLAAGAALFILGGAASALGAIFGVLSAVIMGVGTALSVGIGLVAALLSPIGLVAAAVVGLGAVLLYATGAGGGALDWLKDKFGFLRDEAMEVFGAIKDALASGDFELAAKILWLGLKLWWQRGVSFLRQKWEEFKLMFLKIGTEAFFGLLIVLNNAWAGLETAWVETIDFLRDAWSMFTGWVLKSWNSISGAIRKAWAKVKATVTGTDAKMELTRIDNEVKQKNEEADKARDAAILQRDEERQQRKAQIEADRAGAESEFVNQADAINQQRQAAADAAMAQTDADVEKAKQELKDAMGKVKKPTGGNGGDDDPNGNSALTDLQKAMDAIKNGAATADKKLEANTGAVIGTDEGTKALLAAFRGIGPDPNEDTAKNTKAVATEMKHLKKEAKKTNDHLRGAVIAKVEKAK